MAIRVNHDPSAAVVVPAAYQAGLGVYRQKQSEISRDQFNRDRAAAMQANEQQQRMQLAQQQQAAQQDQMYLQAAMRNQENQQQAALAQQQLGLRQQQFEQANAVDQQQVVQKGLQEGTLRYTAAQKQQMNKLYGDWDRVNQAKNLNPRDRALAQQELTRQLQTIQPRPVTEDERPRTFEQTIQESVVFANGQDPKDGQWIRDKDGNPKWYPPRNTGAGAKKPEVGQPGQPFYLPNDNPLGDTPGEAYGVWGPDGKLVPNPNHPWNKKESAADKKPDPAKDFDAMLAHAKDLFKQNQEGGMSWDDAKEQAKADFAERRSTAGSQDEFDAAAPPASQNTSWKQKQAMRKQYDALYRQVSSTRLPLGVSVEDVLPSPRTATPEEMEAALRQYGPRQPKPQPQQPPLAQDEAASYLDAFTEQYNQPASLEPVYAQLATQFRGMTGQMPNVSGPELVAKYAKAGHKIPRQTVLPVWQYLQQKYGDIQSLNDVMEPEDQQLFKLLSIAEKAYGKEAQANPDKKTTKLSSK